MDNTIIPEDLKKTYYAYSSRMYFEAIRITMLVIAAIMFGIIVNLTINEPFPFWLIWLLTAITSLSWFNAIRIKRKINKGRFPASESDTKQFLIFVAENQQGWPDNFCRYVVVTWFSIGVSVALASNLKFHNDYGTIIGTLIMLSAPAIILYRAITIKLKQRKAATHES